MTKEEAIKLLSDAPADEKPSRINKSLTRKQSVKIIIDGVNTFKDGSVLSELYVKRVHQVCQDRIRPDTSISSVSLIEPVDYKNDGVL